MHMKGTSNTVFAKGIEHVTRKFKKTTAVTATGTSLSKRFNEQNNGYASPEEGEMRRLIFFLNSISNTLRCTRFSFVIALTVTNKVNDLRVSRDS